MVKLSILIPAYNPGHWLFGILESLRKQTEWHPDTEVIVVDDGSTEDLSWIRDKGFALYYRHDKNLFEGKTRNDLMALAVGEYIQFIDADDEIYPNALDVIYDNIEKGFDFVSYEFATDNDVYRSYHNRGQLMVNCPVWAYTFRKEFTGGELFNEQMKVGVDVDWLKRVLRDDAVHWHDDRAWLNYRFDGNDNSICHRYLRGELK